LVHPSLKTLELDVRRAIDLGVSSHVTPGAAGAVVAHALQAPLTLEHFSGRLGFGLNTKVSDDTVYDLASLTKVLSTTLLCAVAIDLGKLHLDEKPWPSWPGVSVAHVLGHTSGLPAWFPLYQEAASRGVLAKQQGAAVIVNAARQVKPVAAPGKKLLYSDLGFIALGALLEERLKDRLDRLFDDVAARYFGQTKLRYVCLYEHLHHPKLNTVAPTELSPWLGIALRGQVYDPNAYAMGGIAGHAGLFGRLDDVCSAARFFLEAIAGKQGGVAGILRAFAKHAGPRPLGFDKPTRGGTTGEALSNISVGHLGFTGTSLWIDPRACDNLGATFVLLTNRVHMRQSSTEGILSLRRSFHQAGAKWADATSA
jgi:CubicO group peptidase (beta-lactamase class C family)